jgi:dTDP-4-dehydrorhamnose 3,5-epimerase
MQVTPTKLSGVLIVEPRVFADERGSFQETFNAARYREAGIDYTFVQDNWSRSKKHVLRGLHYQIEQPQGKLVWCIKGEIVDVAVDLRRSSPTFGQWVSVVLSEANRKQIFVPPGFAHGFCALSDETEVMYKCTNLYLPPAERTILWNDPDLAIDWPISEPMLSEKDQRGLRFKDAPAFE